MIAVMDEVLVFCDDEDFRKESIRVFRYCFFSMDYAVKGVISG